MADIKQTVDTSDLEKLNRTYDKLIQKMALFEDAGKKNTGAYKSMEIQAKAYERQMAALTTTTANTDKTTSLFRNKAVNLGADLTVLSFGVRSVINDISDLSNEVGKGTATFGTYASAIGGATLTVLSMTPAIKAIMTAIKGLGITVASASSVVGVFGTTLAYLGVQIQTVVLFITNLTSKSQGFFEAIENALSNNIIGELTKEIFGLTDASDSVDTSNAREELSKLEYVANFTSMTLANLKADVTDAVNLIQQRFKNSGLILDPTADEVNDKTVAQQKRELDNANKKTNRSSKSPSVKEKEEELNLIQKQRDEIAKLNTQLQANLSDEGSVLDIKRKILDHEREIRRLQGNPVSTGEDIKDKAGAVIDGVITGLPEKLDVFGELGNRSRVIAERVVEDVNRMEEVLNNFANSSLNAFSNFFASFVPPQNALTPLQAFLKSALQSVITFAQGYIIASSAVASAKGITTFGISLIKDAPLIAAAFAALEAAKGFIGAFQTGTEYLSGSGLALVGERGAELIQLPQGTRVYNNSDTSRIMNDNYSFNQSGTSGGDTYISANIDELKFTRRNNKMLKQRSGWKRV